MLIATVTEAKNGLSALIDRVKGGESVLIVDRGTPVARLESVIGAGPDPEGRVARLERAGAVRAARAETGDIDHLQRATSPVAGCEWRERGARREARRPLKFWDSSAIVPLLVGEATTEAMQAIAAEDPLMLVWWATPVECVSAIARLERDGDLATDGATAALQRLDALAEGVERGGASRNCTDCRSTPSPRARSASCRRAAAGGGGRRVGGQPRLARDRHARRSAAGRRATRGIHRTWTRAERLSTMSRP